MIKTKKVVTDQIELVVAVMNELGRQHGLILLDANRLNKSIPLINQLVEIWDEVMIHDEDAPIEND